MSSVLLGFLCRPNEKLLLIIYFSKYSKKYLLFESAMLCFSLSILIKEPYFLVLSVTSQLHQHLLALLAMHSRELP
jgi:hypothetical protein